MYKGKVVDQNNQPIENTSVRIITDETIRDVVVTDSIGLFTIRNNSFSDFTLEFYRIGYKKKQINIKNTNDNEEIYLGNIILEEEIIELDEISIHGNRIIDKGNLMLIFPEKKIINASSTILDLFQKMYIPGLYTDLISQTIQIDNGSNITYKINNVNATFQEILTLNPKNISRIEYQRSPDSRHIDSDGIINILLKKEVGTFLNGNILGAFSTGFINKNLGFSSGYTNSNLNVSYNLSWRDYKKRFADEQELFDRINSVTSVYKKGEYAPFGYLQQNVNIGYNYSKNKNLFNAKFINTIYSSHDKNVFNTYIDNSNSINTIRNIKSNNKYYFPQLDVYYILNLSKTRSIDMNFVGSLGNSKYNRDFREVYIEEAEDNEFKTNIKGINNSIVYEIFFSDKRWNKFSYQLGLKSSYAHGRNNSEYGDIQNEYNNRLDLYPYFSANGKFGKFSYMIGSGLKYLNNKNMFLSKNYLKNISNISFFYQPRDVISMQYIFMYAPHYPQISSLSDIEQMVDNNVRNKGNSQLTPYTSIRNTLNVTYRNKNHISSILTLYHLYYNNPIREIITHKSDYFLIQPQNINNEYSLGAKLETNLKLSNVDFRFGFGFNTYNSKINDIKHKLNNFFLLVVVNYYYKNFTASFSSKKPEKVLTGEQIYQGENNSYINIMYKYKKIAFATGVYFPFTRWSKYSSWRESPIAPMSRKVYIKDNSYMFFIGLSYYFNWGKSLFNLQRNRSNSSIDNSFIKINDN